MRLFNLAENHSKVHAYAKWALSIHIEFEAGQAVFQAQNFACGVWSHDMLA